jgi:hypothetical protein
MSHSAVVGAVTRTLPPGRVKQRWALVEGVMQMVYLRLNSLARSEAALVPELVLRVSYSVPSWNSKK